MSNKCSSGPDRQSQSCQAKSGRERVREALQGSSSPTKPTADGVLLPCPSGPDELQWRSKSTLHPAEASSSFLDEDEDGLCLHF
jgi:hypothetical protein